MVAPAAAAAARATKNGRIGLIGTQASIRSGAYERLIQAENPAAQVLSQPCPLFVPLVENGRFRRGDIVIETVAAEYLAPLQRPGWIPWCWAAPTTPCWRRSSRPTWARRWPLINAGAEGARAVARALEGADALSTRSRGTYRYFVSDRQEDFSHLASIFLGWDVTEAVGQVDISQY